jgi:hypothetical protein
MLKHLIGLANELDRRSLSKEANLVDEIIGAVTSMIEENGSPSEGDLGESENDDSSSKELDFHGYKTNNFHMCPGAVKAFSKINQLDLDENSEAIAVGAAKATDDLLGLEEEVIDNKAASSEQFAEALMLFRVISNDIGELSESLRQDLSEDFSFLDMHIEKIAKHLDNKGEQNVK